jgi:nitrogen fixation protein
VATSKLAGVGAGDERTVVVDAMKAAEARLLLRSGWRLITRSKETGLNINTQDNVRSKK